MECNAVYDTMHDIDCRKRESWMGNAMQKKRIIAILILGILLLLPGCAKKAAVTEESVISLAADGTVVLTIMEPFEQANYSQEDLQEMILTKTAAYNKQNDSDSIAVEKVAVENGQIVVVMKFKSAGDYTKFNQTKYEETELFVGTVKEAYQNGYDLDRTFYDVSNDEKTIGKDELLEMWDAHIMITRESEQISVFDKILYHTDGVEVDPKGKKVRKAEEDDEIVMIVFK